MSDNEMFDGKFKHVQVQLTGNDGNAFAIMGAVSRAMKDNDATDEEVNAYFEASQSGDYDNLLRVACATVDVL